MSQYLQIKYISQQEAQIARSGLPHFSWLLIISLVFTLVGCSNSSRSQRADAELNGALLVWHNWPEPESQLIEHFLDEFMKIHPRVNIASEFVSGEELNELYAQQMASGLGPDLLIGPELSIVYDLVRQDLLLDLSTTDFATTTLQLQAIKALTLDDHLYGIPFAAYTNVLYYDRKIVDEPAFAMTDLLTAAENDLKVAIPTDFYYAYWGIRNFGGQLVDTNGNVLADDGFVKWLEWLSLAQKEGLYLSSNYGELLRFFAEGNAAYFIGDSSELPYLQEVLGEDRVGVARLPYRGEDNEEEGDEEGDNEVSDAEALLAQRFSSGSFLELEVMAISQMSAQKELSLKVIEFFVNQTHQREIAEANLGQIPLHRSVRIDERFSPIESVLIDQSRSAIILPLEMIPIAKILRVIGNDTYHQVLEGVLPPSEAVEQLRQEIQNQLQTNTAEGG
ncbi:MAG: extracellular solute-binding protein [Chloroflexota bacterium]